MGRRRAKMAQSKGEDGAVDMPEVGKEDKLVEMVVEDWRCDVAR